MLNCRSIEENSNKLSNKIQINRWLTFFLFFTLRLFLFCFLPHGLALQEIIALTNQNRVICGMELSKRSVKKIIHQTFCPMDISLYNGHNDVLSDLIILYLSSVECTIIRHSWDLYKKEYYVS